MFCSRSTPNNGELRFYTYHGESGDDDFIRDLVALPDGGFAVLTNSNGSSLTTFAGQAPLISGGTENAIYRYDVDGGFLSYAFQKGYASGTLAAFDDGRLALTHGNNSLPASHDGVAVQGAAVGLDDLLLFFMNDPGRMQ